MGRTKSRYIVAFDTEDDTRGNPYLFAFVDMVGANSFWERTKALRHLERLAEQQKEKGAIVEAWATNLEYDLINLFGSDRISELDLSFGKSYLVGAEWRERNVVFRDTIRHIPIGVKGLGELVGLKKLEFKHESLKERETECD